MGAEHRKAIPTYTFADNYIEHNHVGQDLVLDSEHGDVRRYLFRFNSPNCEEIFKDSERYDNQANRSFMARLYWNGNKVSRVAIMFNGLDETIHAPGPQRGPFSFYDQLGEHLAERNFLAILLPTPYHLNRVMAFAEQEKGRLLESEESYVDMTVPTNALLKYSSNIYRNHFQGFKETVALCRALRPDFRTDAFSEVKATRDCVPGKARTLFSEILEGPIQISLIGYSLGGLRAITEYLRDLYEARKERKRKPIFSTCVAINSGGALNSLPSPSWVERGKWENMIDDLLCQRLEASDKRYLGVPSQEKEAADKHYAFLDDVFLGQAISLNTLAKNDRQISRGMLFVLGGDDQLVSIRSLARLVPRGGLNIFQVAGMGHMLYFDEAWTQWRRVVFDVITIFMKNTPRRSTSFQGLVEFIALLDHHFKLLPYRCDIANSDIIAGACDVLKKAKQDNGLAAIVIGEREVAGMTKKFKITDLDLEAHFLAFTSSLIQRLQIYVSGDLLHPGVYKRTRRELLLGAYITNNNNDLQDAWDALAEANPGERIGEILLRSKFITQKTLEAALLKQGEELELLRKRMASDFGQYLREHSGTTN